MRVLLSKPDALGDQFIAAGLVQALLARRPDIRVVWHVCASRECVAALLGAEVFVPDWAHQAPAAEAARLAAHPGRLILLPFPLNSHEVWSDDLRRRLRWWHAFLQASAWEVSVLGLVNRNWVGDFTVLAAPAPRRLGFEALPMRQPLVNEAGSLAGADRPSFTQSLPASFERAEAAQLQDLFALLEPSLAAAAPPVWRAVPPRPRPAPTRDPRRVAFAPGVGGDPRRAWPLAHFLTLAAEWRARGAEVQWIEGPGDAPYFAGLPEAEFPQRRRFGVGDLAALADALAEVDLLVCHDTSYAHLAAGLGTPTVALFGGGQHRRFHPASARVKVVQGLPPCSGCQWHCLHNRLLCVADLPVAAVRAAVDALLTGDAGVQEVSIPSRLHPSRWCGGSSTRCCSSTPTASPGSRSSSRSSPHRRRSRPQPPSPPRIRPRPPAPDMAPRRVDRSRERPRGRGFTPHPCRAPAQRRSRRRAKPWGMRCLPLGSW